MRIVYLNDASFEKWYYREYKHSNPSVFSSHIAEYVNDPFLVFSFQAPCIKLPNSNYVIVLEGAYEYYKVFSVFFEPFYVYEIPTILINGFWDFFEILEIGLDYITDFLYAIIAFIFNILRFLIQFSRNSIRDAFFFFLKLILSEHAFFVFFFFFFSTNIVSFFVHSYLGMYGIFFFNLLSIFFFWVSLLYTSFFFLENFNKEITLNLGQWTILNTNYRVDFAFYIDSLAFSFILLTATIAFFVYIYAFSYFRYEPHVDRLIIFLNLFVISMIILVSASNLIILFLGWELIGLTSFFLINFWTTRVATLKAAFKAFLFNRISDVSLFFTCVFTYHVFNDLTISVVIQSFLAKPFLMYDSYSCISVFAFSLIIPICIKSAQFFWHIWLPDSMEAPVPASALIHSATLVSAGVYLILRFKSVLLLSEYGTIVLPLIGAFTACLGAVSSAFQTDVKRLLAYSTISHCGFLVVSAIMCDSEYTVFYLYVHGFFKAASFICIGNVIRFNIGYQDIRVMGGYAKFLPFECLSLFVCLLFLAGAPFTLGFFMKHFLLAAIPTSTLFFKFINSLLFVAACLGVVYCSKLYYGIFFGVKKSNKFVYTNSMRVRYYRYDTDSTFFTLATIGASIPIYFLTIFGIVISLIFLLVISNKFCNTPDFGSNVYWVTVNSIKYFLVNSTLFNFGLLNLTMILIFIFICSVSFVWVFKVELIYEILMTFLVLIHLVPMVLFFIWLI